MANPFCWESYALNIHSTVWDMLVFISSFSNLHRISSKFYCFRTLVLSKVFLLCHIDIVIC
ncbi:hypothetical protein PAHAL_1G426300 [Panicum hallii]|uniref:Uncharacterized protein n=1 Tax=Panicum hallii TaxID=206008 RepID=A0A2T8KY54_9POAL|nr:hypothetical protein PAHAL_1G426300 [Panicum hallii]